VAATGKTTGRATADRSRSAGGVVALASFSNEEMHASLDVNIPYYARAIVSTDEIVASISAL
jgi:hypothetical protein